MSRRGIADDDGLRRSGRKSNKKFDNLDLAQIAGSSEFEYMMREANRRLNRSRGHNDVEDEIPMRHSERVSKRRRITVEEEDVEEDLDMGPSDEENKPRSSRHKSSRSRSSPTRKRYSSSLNISSQSRDRSRYDSDDDHEETTTYEITSTVKRKRKQTDFFSPVPEASASSHGLRRGRSSALMPDEDSNQSFPDTSVVDHHRSSLIRTSPISRRTRTLSSSHTDDQGRHLLGDIEEGDTNEQESESGEEEEEEESESNESEPKKYNLRERATTVSYQDSLPEPSRKQLGDKDKRDEFRKYRNRHKNKIAFLSPAHRRRFSKKTSRRKLDSLGSSTSESEDEGGKDDRDEARFEKRKTKSLERARDRFLPMNIDPKDARKGVLRDRMRAVGSSCSDIDPMGIDRSIGFDSVGGLQHHIQGLKEMIVFPMLYPSVFEKFKLQPPRGVIFYGPPGTGKTLVARALANETGKGDKKVSFFMRKGADCLSKWVGESERQLRLLFDQAYTMRPSIIFFDELDGLAPVRSTRQDQIHSSIVSTLLALMDGLDGRGEVVVIGATNRLDSLDPALRRPGRFDRELRFSLPDREARARILGIHTAQWNPPVTADVISRVAEKTVGFCGADLKGVCTEAALISLRQSFPQIYCTNERLQLNLDSLGVTEKDFEIALGRMVPASRRNLETITKPLQPYVRCFLEETFQNIISKIIPKGYFRISEQTSADAPKSEQYTSVIKALEQGHRVAGKRLLICAEDEEFGQTSHLAPAILHALDHLPINSLAIQNIFSETSFKSPEEAVSTILRSAARSGSESGGAGGPSILFLPAIDTWFNIVSPSTWHVLVSIIQGWDVLTPVLFLGTAHTNFDNLPEELQYLFRSPEVIKLDTPNEADRTAMFNLLLIEETQKEPMSFRKRVYKDLPLAPAEDVSKKLSAAEKKILDKQDAAVLRELRIFLREILSRLIRDRRFGLFAKPVDKEDVPDYYDVIKNPMDLSQMMNKIDRHLYPTVESFMSDIDLVCQNALEYNPDFEIEDKTIRHRACALRDAASALIEDELDPEFERKMQEIKEAREARGAPVCPEQPHPFIYAQPKGAQNQQPGYLNEGTMDGHKRYETRSSRPTRRLRIIEDSSVDSVGATTGEEKFEEPCTSKTSPKQRKIMEPKSETKTEEREDLVSQESLNTSKGSTGSAKKRRKVSVWCRPSKRRRVSLNSQQRRKILHQRSAAIKKKYINQMGKPSSSAGSLCSSPTKEPSLPVDQVSLPRSASEKSSDSPIPEPPEFIVPLPELKMLVPIAVAKTKNWPLTALERIYCALSEIITEFEEEWDRSELPDRLRDRLQKISSVEDV